MIFGSGIDTVNYKYAYSVRAMDKLNLPKIVGQEYAIVGFIYRLYEDGYRCFLVTADEHLIRLPKWFSPALDELSYKDLKRLKSGEIKITNIRPISTNGEKFTTLFDLVDRKTEKIFISSDEIVKFDDDNFENIIEGEERNG